MGFQRPRNVHPEAGLASSSTAQEFSEHQVTAPDENLSISLSCRKVNDSVYELHMPSTPPDIDILFFHGLQLQQNLDAHLSTWRSRSADGSIWPKQWLPEDYPNARVLTISYDGSMRKGDTDGRMDMHLVAENLLESLLLADVGQARPVILIGHSFGGLVIKQLCLHVHNTVHLRLHRPEAENQPRIAFLENIRGIFYYATPHRGTQFTDVELDMKEVEGDLVNFVRVFSKDLARLNQDFQDLRENHYDWHVAGVGETLPTDLGGGLCYVIVEVASAICENFFTVREDHFSICQPRERLNTTYQRLVDFIHDVQLEVMKDGVSTAGFQAFPANQQTLPKIQVGLLDSSAGGKILQSLETCPVVGLWGMGGIGKTTLAKAVFNNLYANFEYTLFVENVKLISGSDHDLEQKLLQEVHRSGQKMETDSNPPIFFLLREKDILVVLDDVETDRDIAIISKLQDSCSATSRFLLTSRDQIILSKVATIICEVETLSIESSEMLLMSYAISPSVKVLPEWQQSCLYGIVSHCGGLPLILEVLGKYLKAADSREVWEQTLEALVKVDDVQSVGVGEVWSKLKVSYNSLGDAEKQMFIDAATFFQDKILEASGYRRRLWTLREAKAAWSVTHRNEALRWKTLVDRALVSKVPEDSPIKMHEHLRDLGQKLAEDMKESKRIKCGDMETFSQILHHREFHVERVHSLQVLLDRNSIDHSSCSRCTLKEKFRGVHVVCRHRQYPVLPLPKLNAMKKLQYVQLEHCGFAERKVILPHNVVIFHSLSNWDKIVFDASTNLVILSVRAFELKRLPNSLCDLKSLRFLYLDADVLKCLPESVGSLGRLRTCDLRCPFLEKIPDSFGSLQSLQQLTLRQCNKLEALPESFGNLQNLQQLDMDCVSLKKLPNAFGCLEKLQQLTLQCSKLETLPEAFGGLKELLQLKLLLCDGLESLPDSFGRLQRLHEFMVWRCKGLKRLPDSFFCLGNLQDLTLRDCESLQRLPISFGRLGKLQRLEISRSLAYENRTVCSSLKGLPDSFGGLKELRRFRLHCDSIETLPPSFGGLENLQQLKLECWNLESLPDSFVELDALQELELRSNTLTCLPESFHRLNQLTMLRVNCPSLVTLPLCFGEMNSLEKLYIEDSGLKFLPTSFVKLARLQMLRLLNCTNLESLPTFLGDLEALQELEVSKCQMLDSLPGSLGELKALQKLNASRCGNLERLPESLGELKALKKLIITECDKLGSLPKSLGKLKSLSQLMILKCSQLERLPESLGDLTGLYDFQISHCEKLKRLPESLGELEALHYLEVRGCPKLEGLPDSVGQLRALKRLTLSNLHVESIPSLHLVDSLNELNIDHLSNLAELPVVTPRCKVNTDHYI